MITESLFFKDKIIQGRDLEVIFHKDYVWIFNEETSPVVSFKLTNCQDLATIKFENIDAHNDGVFIDIQQISNYTVFETSDMGDFKTKIICDKVIKEEREYSKEDFTDLIKEILKQRDDEHNTVTKYAKREDAINQFLIRELNIVERKITEANWLTEDKKHFLEGQQNIILKIVETITKSE